MWREMRFRSALTWPHSTRLSDRRTPPRAGRLPACEAASEPHLRTRLRRRWVAVQTRLLRALTRGSRPVVRLEDCAYRRLCASGARVERGHVRAGETVFVLRARVARDAVS